MPNPYFRFKQFTVHQDQCAMKVSTDACIFGAWMAAVFGTLVPSQGRILDIGTGTGLLALMVAQRCTAFITGVELQQPCALQAATNMAGSPWSNRLRVVPGDINDLTFSAPFDAIISNPPFFEDDLPSEDPGRNVARHGDTLTFTQVLRVLQHDLAPTGLAGLLIPHHRMEKFLTEAGALGFYCRQRVLLRQSPQHPCFRAMLWLEKQDPEEDASTVTQEWTIREGDDYGPQCKSLLKDYYLHL